MEKHSSNLIAKTISNLFRRFHLMIFFVFTASCLAVAVILINQILTGDNTDETYTPTINAGSIDSATLERIQSLHASDAAPTPSLPEGRINPFAE